MLDRHWSTVTPAKQLFFCVLCLFLGSFVDLCITPLIGKKNRIHTHNQALSLAGRGLVLNRVYLHQGQIGYDLGISSMVDSSERKRESGRRTRPSKTASKSSLSAGRIFPSVKPGRTDALRRHICATHLHYVRRYMEVGDSLQKFKADNSY